MGSNFCSALLFTCRVRPAPLGQEITNRLVALQSNPDKPFFNVRAAQVWSAWRKVRGELGMDSNTGRMSMGKFTGTPGPWHCDDSISVANADGKLVARVRFEGIWNHGEQEANAALIAAAPALYEALNGLEPFYARDGESSIDRFERVAMQFYRETGLMAPGKDTSPASGQPDIEERRIAYDAWVASKVDAARAALSAAVTLPLAQQEKP